MTGHSHVVESVAFGNASCVETLQLNGNGNEDEADGRAIKEVLASASRDNTIRIWNCSNGECLIVLTGHENWVRTVVFALHGAYLYSCSDDKSICMWSLANGKCNKRVVDAHSHFVQCLAVNPRFPMLASGSADKVVKVWECL